MDGLKCNVTLHELKLFHWIDRDLYTVLVKDLNRNPSECLHIMGLWLWLERGGSTNAVKKILSLPLFVISQLADEAAACLRCLNDHFAVFAENPEIPLTNKVVKKGLSLQFIHENRLTASLQVQNMVCDVCIPALADLFEKARIGGFQARTKMVGPTDCFHESLAWTQIVGPSQAELGFSTNQFGNSFFPDMQRLSRLNIGRDVCPPQVPKCERTLFVTFSKGYPVYEPEVWHFFDKLYGDCIESIHMQDVKPGEQALYARVVFTDPDYISKLLQGVGKAKYTISGKHVWMRKFIAKNSRSSSP